MQPNSIQHGAVVLVLLLWNYWLFNHVFVNKSTQQQVATFTVQCDSDEERSVEVEIDGKVWIVSCSPPPPLDSGFIHTDGNGEILPCGNNLDPQLIADWNEQIDVIKNNTAAMKALVDNFKADFYAEFPF